MSNKSKTTSSQLNQLVTDLREFYSAYISSANAFEKKCGAELVDSAWIDVYMGIENANSRINAVVLERAKKSLDMFESLYCYESGRRVS